MGAAGARHAAHLTMLLHFILALAVIVLTARLLGVLFHALHQPSVMGEMVAGLLLGPLVLGRAWPAVERFLFPESVTPAIAVLAQAGVLLYLFVLGLEPELPPRVSSALVLVVASIAVPLGMGGVLAAWLHPRFAPTGVGFPVFALFIGVSISVTAFPVLARILSDRGLLRSRLGVLALTSAALGDAVAWVLLAGVEGAAMGHWRTELVTGALTLVFAAGMGWGVRPLLAKRVRGGLLLPLVLPVLSSAATAWIGIHALFGAFAAGAVLPRNALAVRRLGVLLNGGVLSWLLPIFFAQTGLHTQLGEGSNWSAWGTVALITGVASAGKWGGSFVAARWMGMAPRQASAVGFLMNTRGLMELIVLGVGRELGILSPALFTMLVLMAVITTLATGPLLDALRLPEEREPASVRG